MNMLKDISIINLLNNTFASNTQSHPLIKRAKLPFVYGVIKSDYVVLDPLSNSIILLSMDLK